MAIRAPHLSLMLIARSTQTLRGMSADRHRDAWQLLTLAWWQWDAGLDLLGHQSLLGGVLLKARQRWHHMCWNTGLQRVARRKATSAQDRWLGWLVALENLHELSQLGDDSPP